jgi:hypothetical protein
VESKPKPFRIGSEKLTARLAFPERQINAGRYELRRFAMVVPKQSAESFAARDRAVSGADVFSRVDESIAKALQPLRHMAGYP